MSVALASPRRVWFDGVLDMHMGGVMPFYMGFVFLAIDIACVVFAMWMGALIGARNFRFIDILGTMTLARAPMLLFAVAGWIIPVPAVEPGDVVMPSAVPTLVMSILAIPILIWYIALMYNGFKVSTNMSGARLIVTFVVCIIAAEIFSKLILSFTVLKLLHPTLL